MKKQVLCLLAVIVVAVTAFLISCSKEVSFEIPNNPAAGTLQSDVTGDCLPKTVNGIYEATVALIPATNTITVQVNVTTTGTYVVTTDTVNGYFFRATGIFTTLGPTSVVLRGNGTPFTARTDNFVISFSGTVCDIAVTVVPAGTGSAVYTANCAAATVSGTYQVGVNLTASNIITIPVTAITTPGTYNITASIQVMTFSGSGILTTAPATITLTGVTTSAPAAPAGTVNLIVGACTIPITMTAAAPPAVFTTDCAGVVVNGPPFQVGVNPTAANTVVIPVTAVATPGSYNFNVAVNGMVFTASGTLTTAPATITLNPSTAFAPTGPAGPYTLNAAGCNIPITITPAASGAANFTIDCATAVVKGAYVESTALVPATNYVDITVTVISTGTYCNNCNRRGNDFYKNSGTFTGTGNQAIRLDGGGSSRNNRKSAVTFTSPASCSFNVYVVANDYFPRTTNSNWSYDFDDNIDPTDSLLRKALSNTITAPAGANAFTIFMGDDGTGFDSSGYYRRNSGDYFEWFDFGQFVNLDNPAWTEYIMLKDNVALNTNWKTGAVCGTVNSGATPICIRFSYTIKEKDLAKTITSSIAPARVYQNVIMVEEKLDYSLDGGVTWMDATSTIDYYGKSYYARGVGLIQFEAFDKNNVLQFKQELRRWQVF